MRNACLFGIPVAAFAGAFLIGQAAVAQDATRGLQVYEENCAVCHQPTGEGIPPAFPALAGNPNLSDLELVVGNIHQGRGNMPPFPHLTAEDVAAVVNYIRTSWGNGAEETTTEEVAGLIGTLGDTAEQKSIWDGVYTEAQVARGEAAYIVCSRCHGRRLNGAADDPDMKSTPPLARAAFLRDWTGQTLASLYEYTRATMPQNNPNSLSEQEYVDIIAYMLSVSTAPAGDTELTPDPALLGSIIIEPKS